MSLRMNIDDAHRLAKIKPLKIQLPSRLRLRLHQEKVVTGKTIAETVQEALRLHFEGLAAASQNPRLPET